MEENQKECGESGKTWKFWILFVAVPIIVIIGSSMVAYVYVKRTSWKQGVEQGLLYAKLNRHTEAIAQFEIELKKKPENAALHYYSGISYIKLKEYDKALEAFDKAISFKPVYSEARLQLATIKLIQASDLRKLGRNESSVLEILLEAEDVCRTVIEKDPNFIQAYKMLADIHSSQGLIYDAIEDYKHMLEIDNSSVNGHIELASLYMSKDELDMARKECDLILSELEPDNIQTLFIVSMICEQQGKYEESMVSLRKIIEKEPENVGALTQLGFILLITSKYDDAFSEIEKVFKLDTGDILPVTAHFVKGRVLLQRKEYKSAITHLEDVAIRAPKMPESHYFLAIALSQIGQTEKAKSEFKSAADLAPDFIPAKLGLAKLLAVDGWHERALNRCEDILKLQPDNVDALQISGVAYMATGDFERAEEQFKKILQFQPDMGNINLANLYLQLGQLSRCISLCESIIESSPEETNAYNILGLAHVRQGNLDKGVEKFKRAIEIKPDQISAYLNLARAFVLSGKTEDTFKTLNKAVSLNPDNVDTRIMLAGLYQREGKLNEAIEAFKKVLKLSPYYLPGYALAGLYFLNGEVGRSVDVCNMAIKLDPDNSFMQINLAVSSQLKGNYKTAIASCQQAIELKPDITSYKIILSIIYAANEEYYKSKKLIESISTIKNDEREAYLELFDMCLHNKEKGRQITSLLNKVIFARLSGAHDIAINECKKAAAIFPDNILPKLILASTYLAAKQSEKAIEVSNEIKKSNPEFTSPYYDLATAYILSEKEDDAISTYQDLLEMDSESVSVRLAISDLLLRKGSLGEAAKIVDDALKLDPENVQAHNLSGRISLAATEYEKADESFSKMIELGSNTFEGSYNMAKTKFVRGEYDECIEYCNIALQTKATDVRVHNILGMAFLNKGKLGDAVAVFNKILSINSDFIPAYLNLAKIYMSAREPGVAATLYKMALKINPDTAEARFGLGGSLASMGKHKEAISEFETIIKSYPDNINTFNSITRSYMALKELDKAQESVMNALGIEPEDPTARYLLAMIHVEKESIPEAINQLNRVLLGNPEFAGAYGLANLYLDNSDYDKSLSICKKGLEHYPENISLWCNMAVSYLLKQDYVNAKRSCMEMLKFQPNGIIPGLCMVSTFLAEGTYGSAELYIESIVKLGETSRTDYLNLIDFCAQNKDIGISIAQHLGRAIAYTDSKWSKRALREYEAITKIAPSVKFAYSAQIGILNLTRQDDKAIDICKKLISLQPEFPDVYLLLADIYNRNGQKDEAEARFRKVISIDPENDTAYLKLGMLLESKELFEESIDSYKKVIELDSSSAAACNNLAWVYALRMQGKMKDALKFAEMAKGIAPNSPAVTDTLGWIYYLNGLYDKATAELEAAVKGAIWNPTIRYHLGMVYYKRGLHRKALTELEKALKISSTFPEAEDAKKLIEKIKKSKVTGTD